MPEAFHARFPVGPERHPFDSAEPITTLLTAKHPESGCFADWFLGDIECFESIFLSRVEGSMSRARVPCRGSISFFFPKLFLEKVIIDQSMSLKQIRTI